MNPSQKKRLAEPPSTAKCTEIYEKNISQPCNAQLQNSPQFQDHKFSPGFVVTPRFPLHALPNTTCPSHHTDIPCHDTCLVTTQQLSSQHSTPVMLRMNPRCAQVVCHPNCSLRNKDTFFPRQNVQHDFIRAQIPTYRTAGNVFPLTNAFSPKTCRPKRIWSHKNTHQVSNPCFRLPQDSQLSASCRKFRYSRDTIERTRPTAPQTAFSDSLLKELQRKPNTVYETHWTKEQITDGLESGSLLSGSLRINPKVRDDSYVKHPLGDADIYIHGLINRNRALPNDLVAVQLEPKENWRVFDTYVTAIPATPNSPTSPPKKQQKYVNLADFLAQQRSDLEKLIGSNLVQKIADDLKSSADPTDVSTTCANGKNILSPWWTVIQRTARVVGIIHEIHPRTCIGRLLLPKSNVKPKNDGQNKDPIQSTPNGSAKKINSGWSIASLIHSHNPVPRLVIPRSSCPEAFQSHPESYNFTRFVARISSWPETSLLPHGELLRSMSTKSMELVESETERILINAGFLWGLDKINYFTDPVIESVQAAVRSSASNMPQELALRRDLRSQCVVTIDPSTARDLDDALHCRVLDPKERDYLAAQGYLDAFYEVGVHIADVSYFVRSDTAVDEEAAKRATTIYLVQLCVPMLPRLLCEELCSLNEGEDKLTFSVIFTVSKQGQYLIDHPQDGWMSDTMPKVEAPHTPKSVQESVLVLYELAMQRRKRRFTGGSLRLDTVKLRFALDDDNQHPVGVSPYIHTPSNWLVEEWMLAANEAVAIYLASHLPQTAFLRRHPPPSLKQLNEASSILESVGIKVNTETAGSIQASICDAAGCPLETGFQFSSELAGLCAEMSSDLPTSEMEMIEQMKTMELSDPSPSAETSVYSSYKERKDKLEHEARVLIIVSLLTKSMNLAEYFCLGELPQGTTTNHYALNMEYYTHFTSPIRRYADILVHRQLAAVLAQSAQKCGDEKMANWYSETAITDTVTSKELQTQAEVCNGKKLSARLAGEESEELFFTLFVLETGPLTEICAVIGILDHSFTVLLLSSGITRRIYLKKLGLKRYEFVTGARVCGRVSEEMKLCLLWNWEGSDPSPATSPIRESLAKGVEAPPCGCFYTEVKLLDMVRCRVQVASTESGDSDSKDNGTDEGLPKLVKILPAPPTLISTEEAERLMEEGRAFQGQLRVVSPSLAFVDHPVDKRRVAIFGHDRSHALNDDIVIVKLHPMGLWKVSGTGPPCEIEKLDNGETSNTAASEFPEADSNVPDSVTADDTLDLDFCESSLAHPLCPEDFYRLPSKYRDLYRCRTLDELTFDPHSPWPADLPWNLNLSASPSVWNHLPSESLIRTGQVVCLFRKNSRSRRLIGQLAFFRPRIGRITRNTPPLPAGAPADDAICLFVPNSMNHTLIKLDPSSIPRSVLENRALGSKTNYICSITGWNYRMNIPSGVICEQLGDMNELEPATEKILLEYGIEDKEFQPEHLQGLPGHPDEFTIPAVEYTQRRDFRSHCILTIDPPSAKDIDDALHVKQLGDGLFEVGIHIADVSYFVKPGTPLDLEAAERTTSVYLVQRIVDSWFGRSIIRSCAKLSYDQALALLKASEGGLSEEKLQVVRALVPEPEAPFSYEQIQESLVWLNRIARNLRKKRLENGALTLQKAKIEFDLPSTTFNPIPEHGVDEPNAEDFCAISTVDKRTIWPRGYSIEAPGPANHLIEEWMLAANQAVAKRLFDEFWDRCVSEAGSSRGTLRRTTLKESQWPGILLRCHEPPAPADMNKLVSFLRDGGIDLQEKTSKGLSDALEKHNNRLKEEGYTDEERSALMDALSHLIYVRMKMAKYFSLDDLVLSQFQSELLSDKDRDKVLEATWHFGLSVPLYTHFTSPIRRYADLIVHRQLGLILDGQYLTSISSTSKLIQQLHRFNYKTLLANRARVPTTTQNQTVTAPARLSLHASWCNHKRMMSRRAQEASQRLFLTACLRFLKNTTNWEVISTETSDKNKRNGSISTIRVEWIPAELHATDADPSDAKQLFNVAGESVTPCVHELSVLSVVPCRIYCLPNRLSLHAEFLTSATMGAGNVPGRIRSKQPGF
ncbi:DIS3 exonuclease 2 [Fasciola hepatica]|uniref:DIS3 exonuclease 2 n=1 Tax=Fasciola hepatica TaxID=6192 RepID=A0A4E0S4B6_FASHE|nr:DIS3 exonuclease 2 [Fasciola hepatica]